MIQNQRALGYLSCLLYDSTYMPSIIAPVGPIFPSLHLGLGSLKPRVSRYPYNEPSLCSVRPTELYVSSASSIYSGSRTPIVSDDD